MMEIALIENLQRKDLTPFEEADGLRALADSYGYTHEMMADRLGKSRSSVTEVLALAGMPEKIRERCRLADIHSKSVLLQIVRRGTPEKMMVLIDRLQAEGTTRAEARRLTRERRPPRGRGRPRHFKFSYAPKGASFSLSLHFKKAEVPREEIIATLEAILDDLKRQ